MKWGCLLTWNPCLIQVSTLRYFIITFHIVDWIWFDQPLIAHRRNEDHVTLWGLVRTLCTCTEAITIYWKIYIWHILPQTQSNLCICMYYGWWTWWSGMNCSPSDVIFNTSVFHSDTSVSHDPASIKDAPTVVEREEPAVDDEVGLSAHLESVSDIGQQPSLSYHYFWIISDDLKK